MLDVFDGQSRTYLFDWNDRRQVTKLVDPLGHEVDYAYTSAGDLESVRDGNGGVWSLDHTDFGQRTRIEAPDGTLLMAAAYDDAGRITSVTTDGVQRSITYTDGRAAGISDPEGRTITLMSDLSGNPTGAAVGPLSYSIDIDQESGAVSIGNALGGGVDYTFDPEGRATSMTNGQSAHLFGYDSSGRIETVIDPLGNETRHRYDTAGRIIETIDRNGVAISYGYDTFGRLGTIGLPDGDAVTYEYDSLSRIVAVQDNDSRVEQTLDYLDRTISITTTGRGDLADIAPTTISYGYDAHGLVTSMTSPAGTVGYEYTAGYSLQRVVDIDGSSIDFGRDQYGRVKMIERPNGVVTTATYTPSGRFDRIEHRKDSTVIDRVEYAYNPVTGLTDSYEDHDGLHVVTHDDSGRLTGVDHPNGRADESYAYNAAGNRIGDGQTYDAGHRLLSDDSATYDYDAEGRLLAIDRGGEQTSYTWDGRGNLATVDGPAGRAEWRYDALGRPITLDDGGGRTQLVHDAQGSLVAEINASATLDASYTPGPGLDQPLVMRRGGDELWFNQDASGSVTSLTGPDGGTVEQYRYDSFGTPQQTAVSGNPFGFGARPWDELSGTYDMRARRLDPRQGRFLSEDPMIGTNPYEFAFNDPFSATDPDGMMALSSHTAILNKTARVAAGFLGFFVIGVQNGSDAGKWIEWLAGVGGNNVAGRAAARYCLGPKAATGVCPNDKGSGIVCLTGIGAATGGLLSTIIGFAGAAILRPEELAPDRLLHTLGAAFAGGAVGGGANGITRGATERGLVGAWYKGMWTDEAASQFEKVNDLWRKSFAP